MRNLITLFLITLFAPISASALLCQEILIDKPTLEVINQKFVDFRAMSFTDYASKFTHAQNDVLKTIERIHNFQSFEHFTANIESSNLMPAEQLAMVAPSMYRNAVQAIEQTFLPHFKTTIEFLTIINKEEPPGELPLTGLYAQELLAAAMRIPESHPLKTEVLQTMIPLMEMVEAIGRTTKKQ